MNQKKRTHLNKSHTKKKPGMVEMMNVAIEKALYIPYRI